MSDAPDLDTCGCCQGTAPLTPAPEENRPGLTEIAYRAGTHGSFKETMHAALSRQPALRDLTARDDDDPALALIDGWATVLDVLTFYQERIANEGYLRTATERRSVLELARAIGYELNPGVAASTYLAFTLETAPGAPPSAVIAAGAKAQSIPRQDEHPQLFETVETIEARPAWNALAARTRELRLPAAGDTDLYLLGTATQLKTGDPLLLVGDGRRQDPGSDDWELRRVKAVATFPANAPADAYTVVTLDQGLARSYSKLPTVYALRQRASLFGHNAPDWRTLPATVKHDYLGRDPFPSEREWPGLTIAAISDPPPPSAPGMGLYGEYYQGTAFDKRLLSRTDPQVDFGLGGDWPPGGTGTENFSVRWTGWVAPEASGPHTFFVNADDGVRLWVDGQLVIDHWVDQGATKYSSPALNLTAGQKVALALEYYQHLGGATISLSWAPPGGVEEVIPQARLYPRDVNDVHLDAVYPQALAGSWVVLALPGQQQAYSVESAAEDGRLGFTLSAKTTRLTLQGKALRQTFDEHVRETSVFLQSEALDLAPRPVAGPAAGAAVDLALAAEGLAPGRLLALSGVDADSGKPASEVAVLLRAEPAAGATRLVLTAGLAHRYRPETLAVNANVARATHGETRAELLGGGDGSQPFQRFTLKQKPLTYVAAPTPSGARSTLAVRVDGVRWDEVPSLYLAAPGDRVYVTRLADDGTATVEFGDGRLHGARLPTGAQNVAATYRVGTGLEGLVDAGQISLLLTRPLGVQGVTNPTPPTGAADPERLDDARRSAPLTVLTLERVVSLSDFEDFARSFGGIGKAQATWLWDGERRLVHLTVAAADGGPVVAGSALDTNLRAALDAARTVEQPLRIASFQPRSFGVEARLWIDPRYRSADVFAAARAALVKTFSFAARDFGQAVTASEVIATLQGVPGVAGAVLDGLALRPLLTVSPPDIVIRGPIEVAALRPTQAVSAYAAESATLWEISGLGGAALPIRRSPPPSRLPAATARWAGGQILPAELLTVDPASIALTEVTA